MPEPAEPPEPEPTGTAARTPPEPTSPAPPSAAGTTAAPEEAGGPPPEDWANRYRYLLADFENYRRRTEREREAITRQARGAIVRELLPILEAFRAAREAAGSRPAADPIRHGLELLDREWTTFLKHEGVTPIARVGEAFRADEQEAVGEALPRDGVPDGAVAEVVQQGYRFFGGVLRPAKVVVARARPATPTPDAPPEEST
ncbi:GrpE nucleotide exchange factor [mine drainage metagenome]|uniref:GrpE nucleotide exchange factor n=1 Tax=mine drainage metagenome TaxID=410659 RepID=T1BUC1_9ZZZZ